MYLGTYFQLDLYTDLHIWHLPKFRKVMQGQLISLKVGLQLGQHGTDQGWNRYLLTYVPTGAS